jgi:hypothetical protein
MWLIRRSDNRLGRCVKYSFSHPVRLILLSFIYISQNIYLHKNVEIYVFRKRYISLHELKQLQKSILLPIMYPNYQSGDRYWLRQLGPAGYAFT